MYNGLSLPTPDLLQFIVGAEWIILIFIVIVLLFGAKKIPELAKGFGKAKTEFEKAKVEAERELQNNNKGNMTDNAAASRDKLESIANSLGIDYINKDDETLRSAIKKELNRDNVL